MLLVISVENNSMSADVSKRFGHANYYLLYDTEKKSSEYRQDLSEGHNHNIIDELISLGVKSFIGGNIGPHAFGKILEGGADFYLARKLSASEAVEMFLSGNLKKLDEPTVKKSIGHH